jgi:hypothetical protein
LYTTQPAAGPVPDWNKRFVASHVGDMKKRGPLTDGDNQSRSPDHRQGEKERVKTNCAGNAGLLLARLP